ncbi:MAG: alpha/beta hydrolase, partial [Acidimicrobiia bacterium]|nr:alpha/beta hydrolase [Acidimicrobiia bacterium]
MTAAYRDLENRLWEFCGVARTGEHMVTIPVTGTKVRVQEVGDGPPVLYLHGSPNSGSTWVPILPFMAGFRSLLVDRPGTGLSEPAPISSLEEVNRLADRMVVEVMDGLGIEKAHLVASSLGGYIALRSAAAAPDRFDRMVQMALPGGAPGWRTPVFMKAMSLGAVRRILGILPPSQRANDSIMRQIGHGKTLDAGGFPEPFNEWYLALARHTDTMKNETEMISFGVTLKGWDPELTLVGTLERVPHPTLFLWGADDGFGGEDVARATVGLMPNAELRMFPDQGHLPWLDDPEVHGEATAAWLRLA